MMTTRPPYRAENGASQIAHSVQVIGRIQEGVHRFMMKGCIFRLRHDSSVLSSRRVSSARLAALSSQGLKVLNGLKGLKGLNGREPLLASST